ncbi:unnamed protein product [Cyprideis torosa]|uniref:riboflavin kinase n=1 Tax=Cyprideis torosa TaxID=163714 RepID=A0A7R8ZLU8_9CRUS|nr:unnamed protein product [Cyprideis torosa]CAG0887494.1 unnamed protein product [Cyprideis torosa]
MRVVLCRPAVRLFSAMRSEATFNSTNGFHLPAPPGTPLPYFTSGEVVRGFGRGSREIGCPTANFSQAVVDDLPPSFATGIYFGWASINGGPVYKMVMSVGWNPYFKNQKKSMETHILHKFPDDFYGFQLYVGICGYLRPEMDFSTLGEKFFDLQ